MTGVAQQAGGVGSERRLDLDWVRIAAFGLLIFYHCGMFYVPWAFHVKSPHPLPWLQAVMVLTNPWRLSLLFLVSGCATRFMADKMSARVLWKARMARLLPPLLFGMVVIVPPQTFMQVTWSLHQAVRPVDFYLRYITAGGHWVNPQMGRIITPTWNHLWFVAYLLVYSAILCATLGAARGGVRTLQTAGERLLAHPWALMGVGLAGALFTRFVVAPRFPETHALVGDWKVHAESALPFAFGYLFAKSPGVWAAMVRARLPALVWAMIAYAAYAAIQFVWWDYKALPPDVVALARASYAVEQWSAIVAILGYATRYLSRVQDTPARRYLTDAIFPFYIVHQTIIVVAAPLLASRGMPQGLEAALLIAITTAGCFAAYEVVRRAGPLRPLFGLSRWPKSAAPGGFGRTPAGIGLGPAGQDAI